MHEIPIERRVWSGGLLDDDEDLQRNGDHEPEDADGEEAYEARFVRVVVGEEGCEVAAVAVQADQDKS